MGRIRGLLRSRCPAPGRRAGYGPRVHALAISPYARPGSVDHTVYDFTSVLRLLEDTFGVPPLSTRDAQATSIASSLDLTQAPLAPYLIDAPPKAPCGGPGPPWQAP